MDKTVKRATIGFLTYILIVTIAYAGWRWIYSPTVTVDVTDYTLTLNVSDGNPTLYDIVKFWGILTVGGSAIADANITLFKNDVATDWNITDPSGNFEIYWNATELGSFTFKAGYEVP